MESLGSSFFVGRGIKTGQPERESADPAPKRMRVDAAIESAFPLIDDVFTVILKSFAPQDLAQFELVSKDCSRLAEKGWIQIKKPWSFALETNEKDKAKQQCFIKTALKTFCYCKNSQQYLFRTFAPYLKYFPRLNYFIQALLFPKKDLKKDLGTLPPFDASKAQAGDFLLEGLCQFLLMTRFADFDQLPNFDEIVALIGRSIGEGMTDAVKVLLQLVPISFLISDTPLTRATRFNYLLSKLWLPLIEKEVAQKNYKGTHRLIFTYMVNYSRNGFSIPPMLENLSASPPFPLAILQALALEDSLEDFEKVLDALLIVYHEEQITPPLWLLEKAAFTKRALYLEETDEQRKASREKQLKSFFDQALQRVGKLKWADVYKHNRCIIPSEEAVFEHDRDGLVSLLQEFNTRSINTRSKGQESLPSHLYALLSVFGDPVLFKKAVTAAGNSVPEWIKELLWGEKNVIPLLAQDTLSTYASSDEVPLCLWAALALHFAPSEEDPPTKEYLLKTVSFKQRLPRWFWERTLDNASATVWESYHQACLLALEHCAEGNRALAPSWLREEIKLHDILAEDPVNFSTVDLSPDELNRLTDYLIHFDQCEKLLSLCSFHNNEEKNLSAWHQFASQTLDLHLEIEDLKKSLSNLKPFEEQTRIALPLPGLSQWDSFVYLNKLERKVRECRSQKTWQFAGSFHEKTGNIREAKRLYEAADQLFSFPNAHFRPKWIVDGLNRIKAYEKKVTKKKEEAVHWKSCSEQDWTWACALQLSIYDWAGFLQMASLAKTDLQNQGHEIPPFILQEEVRAAFYLNLDTVPYDITDVRTWSASILPWAWENACFDFQRTAHYEEVCQLALKHLAGGHLENASYWLVKRFEFLEGFSSMLYDVNMNLYTGAAGVQ